MAEQQSQGFAPVSAQAADQQTQQTPGASVGSDAAVGQANELTSGMLRIGSQGAAVEHAQGLLNGHGAELVVDGIFGPITHRATARFQLDRGLMADGIIGPQTWAALGDGGQPQTDRPPQQDRPPEQTPPQQDRPPEQTPPERPPQPGGALSPFQREAATQLPGLIASPGVQASPLAPVTRSLTGQALEGDAQAPVPSVDGVQQAKSIQALAHALKRIVVDQEPCPGGDPPATINDAKNRSANPKTSPAEVDWLYDFQQAVGIMGLLVEWQGRTDGGEALDSGRASIVALALGDVGKVEARNPGGGAPQPPPSGGRPVLWRKGAADFDRIFTKAGSVADDGHRGAGVATRRDIYDATKGVGLGQPVPSWCGIFVLAMHKYAGRTSANWAGHNAPWVGKGQGDAAYHAVDLTTEFPKPGDIAYQEESRSLGGGQHHGTVIKVTPTDPQNPRAGFRVMTVDGNFTAISSIVVHEEDRTWWDGFFRAAPKGS